MSDIINMMIMKRDLLDAYCSWFFPILFALEDEIDVKNMPAFDARLFGRVSVPEQNRRNN